MEWVYASVSVVGVVALLGWVVARHRKVIPVESVIAVRPGAFSDFAAKALGPTEPALADFGWGIDLESRPGALRKVEERGPAGPDRIPPIGWVAAAIDGGAPGFEMWSNWASVDERVLQAVEHMSHEQIDGFADLLNVVTAREYQLETEGFFSKLLGHIGEWHVQEDLIEAGIGASMPLNSNEPGADIFADGHPLNVKTWHDAGAAARDHFAEHPDIPIVVPADSANIPEDALDFDPAGGFDAALLEGSENMVIVDAALSHAEIAEQTTEAIELLQSAGPNIGIPLVTVAISGLREGRLLMKGATSAGRAAKNLVVDTGGVGGGSLAGLKVGALAGAPFGPVGTAVGAAVGGFAGAIGGRMAANRIRRAPLTGARRAYEAALAAFKEARDRWLAGAASAWESAQLAEHAKLEKQATTLHGEARGHTTECRSEIQACMVLRAEDAEQYLGAADALAGSAVRTAEEALSASVRGLARAAPALFRPLEVAKHRALRREARVWREAARSLLADWASSPAHTARLFDLVLAVPGGERTTNFYLRDVHRRRVAVYALLAEKIRQCSRRMAEARLAAVEQLKQSRADIAAEVRRNLAPVELSLAAAFEAYKAERRRAGVAE